MDVEQVRAIREVILELSDNQAKQRNVLKKQSIQTKKFFITLNNYSEQEFLSFRQWCEDNCTRYVIGKEIGKLCGTPHLQINLHTKTKMRFEELKNKTCSRIFVEKQKGSDGDAFGYCQKDGEYVGTEPPPYLGADLPEYSQLKMWQLEILEIIKTPATSREVHWYWESIGNTGKSTFQKYLGMKHNACVAQKGKYNDIMYRCSMHTNLNLFVVDVPRTSGNLVSYNALESIKGGTIINDKYEGGQKFISPVHIFVFANFPPDKNAMSDDRWRITEITEKLT